MSDIAVRVQNISKQYKIGAKRHDCLKGLLSSALNGLVRRSSRSSLYAPLSSLSTRCSSLASPPSGSIWALKDVSFELKQGETLGIIGRNGAGKSTLLKVLSRITEPTSGRAEIYGRVGSLLEVGIGFDRELTGRENIYLNGAILGMTKREIDRKFDEIVDFSGVEEFIDTPVKHYSSGMYVRLAFAVAAHLEPEILIVDEVLAVGDAPFQKKCLGKMNQVAKEGRTVLFVSHNMGSIRSLCARTIVVEEGKIVLDADPGHAITNYLLSAAANEPRTPDQTIWRPEIAEYKKAQALRLREIKMTGPSGTVQSVFEADKNIQVEIDYEVSKPITGIQFYLHVLTEEGESAFSGTDCNFREAIELPGIYRTTCFIPAGLLNRRSYYVEISCYVPSINVFLIPRRQYLRFAVTGVGNHGSYNTFDDVWPGVVCPALHWKVEQLA